MFGILKSLFGSASPGFQISDNAFLVDVRTPGEYASGHVKGSANIPLDQIQNQLAKFNGKTEIVVFCRSGMRSSQAKAILERNGFNNVINGGTWNRVNQMVQQKNR